MRNLLWFDLPPVLWALLCAGALLTPSSALPGEEIEPLYVPVVELAVHFLLAAVLAALAARALGRRSGSSSTAFLAPLLSFVYLVGLEIAQEFVPGRGWGWDDVAVTLVAVTLSGLWMASRRTLLARGKVRAS